MSVQGDGRAIDALGAPRVASSAQSVESIASSDGDAERRFGGLRRLYGEAGYQRIRNASVAVVGLGGVGSWAVEALARSGVRALVLIDFDHVAESNINRQVQATLRTVGMAKGEALRQRINEIHPDCDVHVVDEFASAANWPGLLPLPISALIDACDQGHAKLALALWARSQAVGFVCAGAAGGKQLAQCIEVADLAEVSHDPLLASLRQRLRKAGAPRQGKMGVACVFSREAVALPPQACAADVADAGAGLFEAGEAAQASLGASAIDSGLNCSGYGSSVAVTASFGMVAAGEVLRRLAAGR